eukprot:2828402-Amphidinium_carterae.2
MNETALSLNALVGIPENPICDSTGCANVTVWNEFHEEAYISRPTMALRYRLTNKQPSPGGRGRPLT